MNMSNDNRPLSPHLDIYRWRVTMLSSTLHRLSGIFVSFGLAVLAMWLAVIASGHGSFTAPGFIAKLFWFVWSAAIYFHLCNGIRHLLFDVGKGFEIKAAEKSAKIVIIAAAALTVLTWLIVLVK